MWLGRSDREVPAREVWVVQVQFEECSFVSMERTMQCRFQVVGSGGKEGEECVAIEGCDSERSKGSSLLGDAWTITAWPLVSGPNEARGERQTMKME